MQDSFSNCREVHRSFIENPDYEAFREPVKWKENGLLDYPTIIKCPMDLGTIDRKLKRESYKTPAEFIFDMRLIYRNCMTYNIESSQLYEVGKRFMEEFEVKVKELNLYDFAFKLAPEKTKERVDQLLREIESATPEVKDCVMNLILTMCPKCLISTDLMHYTFSPEKITAETLDYLLEFIVSMRA